MATQLEMIGTIAKPKQRVRTHEEAVPSLEKRTRPAELIIRLILLFCGVISIFTTIGIVYVLGEQALLFLDSRAWVRAKMPVAEVELSATLAEGLDEGERTLSLVFEGERVPFNNQQLIMVGDEIMRITDRGRSTVRVERGVNGTNAVEHVIDAPIFAMNDQQIRPINALTDNPNDNVLLFEDGFGTVFEVDSDIQLGTEIMRITAVTDNSITVIRGEDDTEIHEHDADDDTVLQEDPVSIGEFFTSTEWQPQAGKFGIWSLMTSTLMISFIALLVAIPLGLGAAIYLSEYADRRVRNILKPILEILAGVPTVVYGFFALTFVTPNLQSFFGGQVEFNNMLSAGLVVGVLLVPLISSMSEDALTAVPRALREASYGLGATRLETTVKVVLPAAISGIMAAFILAVSRAVGETMIVAIAAGSGPNFTFDVFEGAETMTGHIARISGGDLSYNSIDYNSIFAIGLMLFVMTLLLNIFSGWVSNRLREEY